MQTLNLDLTTLDAAIAAFPDNTAIAAAVKNAFLTASKALTHAVAVINNPVNADMNAFDVAKNFTSDADAARADVDASTTDAVDIAIVRAIAARIRATHIAYLVTAFAEYVVAEVVEGISSDDRSLHAKAADATTTDVDKALLRDADLLSFDDNKVYTTTVSELVAKVKELEEFFNNWKNQRT
ncbi:hypothetical protein AGMMS49531_07680 [Endomicrobiia bacterium]|nr:hypothetical protein AGMMS49531_07680 [Endomicrobiia bacterium]